MAPDFVSAERRTQLGFQSRGPGHPTEPRVPSPTPQHSAAFLRGEGLGVGCGPIWVAEDAFPIMAQETEPEVLRPLCPHCLVGVWKWKHPKLEILTDSVVWGRGSGVGGCRGPSDHPDSTPRPLFSVYDLETWSASSLSTAMVCSGLDWAESGISL